MKGANKLVSLAEYVDGMKDGQDKIYYIVNQQYDLAMKSPYMEPFKNSDLDILILTNNVDEILFQQNSDYKGKKFVSVESNFDEIQKDLGLDTDSDSMAKSRIPENDISPFCIWLKEELKQNIGKVKISKRLTDTPAIVSGEMSSSMRIMMQMMEAQGQINDPNIMKNAAKDQTLEINASHPIIVNLNQLRKKDKVTGSLIAKKLMDSVLLISGIPFDMQEGTDRSFQLINAYLELSVNQDKSGGATRATQQAAADAEPEVTIEMPSSDASEAPAGGRKGRSALKQARDQAREGGSDENITIDHTITNDDYKK